MHPYLHFLGNNFPSYTFMIAIGAIIAVLIALLVTVKKHGYDMTDFAFFILWMAIGGILGAKLLYIIVELKALIERPELIPMLLRGGGVFYGGLIGGLIGAFIAARRKGWNYLACLDTCAAPLCFAHALGRVGCFLGGCCYGMETDCALGVIYPDYGFAPAGVKLLPTQLFEAAFLLLLGAALLIVFFKTKKTGLSVVVYMIAYGVWRFIIEFFRGDERGHVGALSTSQFISIFIVLAGIVLLLFLPRANAFFEKLSEKHRKEHKKT